MVLQKNKKDLKATMEARGPEGGSKFFFCFCQDEVVRLSDLYLREEGYDASQRTWSLSAGTALLLGPLGGGMAGTHVMQDKVLGDLM